MGVQIPRPTIPFTFRNDMTGIQLVSFASNYITSARAMMDVAFNETTSDETFGLYHLICMAEAVIEGAEDRLDKDFVERKKTSKKESDERLRRVLELLEGSEPVEVTNRYIRDCKAYLGIEDA